MLISLEPRGIFGSNFAYLFIMPRFEKEGVYIGFGLSDIPSFRHSFVSAQYLENKLIEFHEM